MTCSSVAILRSVSATDRVMRREAFGQRIVPKAGSIVAAPETDLSGGDPDYFFHWLRDSALVMDALRLLYRGGRLPDAATIFDDFVAFSLALNRLDGAYFLRHARIRETVRLDHLVYLRSDDDLRHAAGEALPGEVRFNPDGTLDIVRWNRPQNDGPALRALSLLRWRESGLFGKVAAQLLAQDLAFVERHWAEPCYDLWEEQLGHHDYTRLVQMAALEDGAAWMAEIGKSQQAQRLHSAAHALREELDRHWSAEEGCYRSRSDAPRGAGDRALDTSVVLAVLHANRGEGAHSVLDPKVHATFDKLEELFTAEYRINAALPAGRGPAMGRYAGDRYVSGGAWYMTTLAAAEFFYRLAGRVAQGCSLECSADNASFLVRVLKSRPTGSRLPSEEIDRAALTDALLGRGDAFMTTVRDYTPDSGELSEQFDRTTGRQTSAKNLAWSYAAFITAYEARRGATSPKAA